jgi:hypothetical protein
VDPLRLSPPPDLPAAAAALRQREPPALAAEDPTARLLALAEAGPAGAFAWGLGAPERARQLWAQHARLGLAALERRVQQPSAGDGERFWLGAQASAAGQRAALAGERAAGRRADLLACELATGGWPGRDGLDRPNLVLLLDPTGANALAYAGSRLRLGTIRDFPVASPEGGGSWMLPGTVDRLLFHVDRQAHLGGPLLAAASRLLRTLVHPAVGPTPPPAASRAAQRRLAALAGRDAGSWAFALPWLLDTARQFPGRLAVVAPA